VKKVDRRRRFYERKTAIMLTAAQDEAVLAKAKKLCVPYAEVIRRAVEAYAMREEVAA
jgi:hypothetical protein